MLFSGLCGAWIQESISDKILDPEVRDRIRHEWDVEFQKHREAIVRAQLEEQDWHKKKQRREREEAEWIKKARSEREADEVAARRRRENELRLERKEAEWIRKERSAREADEVAERRRRENEQRLERKEAERVERVRRERMAEEREWQRKKQSREREEAEWIEREKRRRERMRLYWDDIRSDPHCIAHGTRKYTARLANLQPGIDPIEACKTTPFTIHGVTYDSPAHCEDHVSYISFRTNI